MDILKLGAELLRERLGVDVDSQTIQSALGSLLGGSGEKIDIAGLVTKFTQQGGMQDIVSSWLGDGSNKGIDASKVMEMFGSVQMGEFASKLGTDESTAAGGLADIIPQMIDKASGGGSLLDSIAGSGGGAGGLLGAAKGLFGR